MENYIENEKKVRTSISINPTLNKKVEELYKNKSKYIEWLIYKDLRKNKQIDEITL